MFSLGSSVLSGSGTDPLQALGSLKRFMDKFSLYRYPQPVTFVIILVQF